MKKTILYIFVVIGSLFFYTCKKDAAIMTPTPVSTPTPIAPDSINYTDIADISLISTTVMHPSMCGVIPSPNDTTMSDSIDIDLDGIFDMKFVNTHYYNPVSASSPCVNYNCYIQVNMINIIDTIAFYNNEYWWIDNLYLNDTIDNDLNYNYFNYPFNNLIISYHCQSGPPGIHNFTGEKYLGFKMFRSGKTMFGWVRIESIGYNGVIIKDFAINKTNNNPILCGQQF